MLRTRSAKQWTCLFAAGLLAATFNGYGSSGGEGGGTTPRSRTNLGSVVAAAAAAAANDTATNPNAAPTCKHCARKLAKEVK